MVQGRVDQAHLFNKNKTKPQQIRSVGEDLIREDLCDEDHISASQDQDAPGSPSPYDRHNASVSQTTKSAGTREGRYRPIRSNPFKRQNERRKSSR